MLFHTVLISGHNLSDLSEVVYYEKPLLTFERLLETCLGSAPGAEIIYCSNASLAEGKTFFKDRTQEKP